MTQGGGEPTTNGTHLEDSSSVKMEKNTSMTEEKSKTEVIKTAKQLEKEAKKAEKLAKFQAKLEKKATTITTNNVPTTGQKNKKEKPNVSKVMIRK